MCLSFEGGGVHPSKATLQKGRGGTEGPDRSSAGHAHASWRTKPELRRATTGDHMETWKWGSGRRLTSTLSSGGAPEKDTCSSWRAIFSTVCVDLMKSPSRCASSHDDPPPHQVSHHDPLLYISGARELPQHDWGRVHCLYFDE